MVRFVLLAVVTLVAACGTGPVPEELYYGPNKHRLGPRPFPPGPEGPWVETNSRGEPGDDGLVFDRGVVCSFDLDEAAYEQFTIDCECGATYEFRGDYVAVYTPDRVFALYLPYELSEGDTKLTLADPQGSSSLRLDRDPDVQVYVRPPIMFGVEDCTRFRGNEVLIVSGP